MGGRSLGTRIVATAMLVLALLWAQTLAQRHGVVHHAQSHPLASNAEHAADVYTASASWPGHEEGDAQCRLFDQLLHADGLPSLPFLTLPLALSAGLVTVYEGLAVARWAALFQARAPPSVC